MSTELTEEEKRGQILKEYEVELLKMYGAVDNDSFQSNDPDAGADLEALPEYETNFAKMLEEMFINLPEEKKLLAGAIHHEQYEDLMKSMYNDVKTNLQTTSRVNTNGATTDDLVVGQSTLHTLEQAAEALCDDVPPASARTDVDSDLSPSEASGQ